MATQTEKLLQNQELELTKLNLQVVALIGEVAPLQQLAIEVATLKQQLAAREDDTAKLQEAQKEIAVLKHQVAELAKTKDTWGNRIWLVVTITLSAFFATLTAILGALLTFTLNAKK